ncbi:MAG: phage minor tail protein L [Desulfobacteraceae bacterium]|nr:phage minor tail protein L [Desulfobacteraceae bacterium]
MISSDSQKLDVGQYIELFQFDTRILGGDVYYFTKTIYSDRAVKWRDINTPPGITEYTPIDLQIEGFETNGEGSLPRPKVTVSNVNRAMGAAAIAWNDLLRATIYRYRTLKKYLAGEANEDLSAHWPVDIYRMERKTDQNKFYLAWELKCLLDCEGQKLPRRQVLRNACRHVYRTYISSTGTFDYTEATCPYAGTAYYNALGNSVTVDKDRCGKRVSDCRLRFTGTQGLPTTAFPGLAKVSA